MIMSTEKRKSEKQQYNDLHTQVYSAYESASPEVKQTIDAWAQSLANYESADPLSNSHARKLHIDTYQRMLKYMQSENPYDPTTLGVAKRNGFGRYSNDDITRIGNQLAYKFFNQDDKPTSFATQHSTTSTQSSNAATGHYSFVWNKGLNSSFLLDSDTWNDKASIFADALLANFTDTLEKKNNGYAIHGLPEGITTEDLANAVTTLGAVKNVNWDTPNEQTKNVFNALREIATKFNFDPSEFSYYFNVSGNPAEETDPKKAAHQAKLKELGLTEASDIDSNALTYMKKMGWQALTDEDGITRLYNANYQPIRQQYSYIDDNPDNPNKFAFFVNSDGQYLHIPNLTNDYDKNLATNPFAAQIGDEIKRLVDSHSVFGKGIEFTYDPYSNYYHKLGDNLDNKIQTLLDKVADEIKDANGNPVENYSFVDVSRYFGSDTPIIAVLPANEPLKHDMFGNPQLPDTGYYYMSDNGTLQSTTRAYLNTKFGYNYSGYGSESEKLVFQDPLQKNIFKHINDADTMEFNPTANMYGTNWFGDRFFTTDPLGPEASKNISENPEGWVKEIISFILNPNQLKNFKNTQKSGRWILNELGYTGKELQFIQGLYAFIQNHNLENKIGKSTMRKLFEEYNRIYNQKNSQAVEIAQQGTILTDDGKKVEKPEIKQKYQPRGEQVAKDNGLGIAITTLALDVVSLATSFIPVYGTLTSLVTGYASTAAQLWGDIKSDGFDFGDMANFATNATLDTIGVVGGAGKVAKIAKKVGAYAPVLIGIFHGVSNGKQYSDIIQKMGRGEHLSINEWMTLAQGMNLLVQGTKGGIELGKYKKISALRNTASKGVSEDIRVELPVMKNGKSDKVEISIKDAEKIKNAKGKAAVEAKTDSDGKLITPESAATTDREEAISMLRQITGDDTIDLPSASGSEFNLLNFKTWSRKNRNAKAEANPLEEIDLNSLNRRQKTTQADIDNALQQIHNYENRLLPWRKRDGGKLDRLQQYINKK